MGKLLPVPFPEAEFRWNVVFDHSHNGYEYKLVLVQGHCYILTPGTRKMEPFDSVLVERVLDFVAALPRHVSLERSGT